MACETPSTTEDCTSASPCGSGCGCAETTATPTLPKCQDISLTAGAFTHATVVVNAAGCITSVTSGVQEIYTPDECCDGGSGGSSTAGPRGDKGDPGSAATIQVDPVITPGTGSVWSVQNLGTTSAAIFKFTSPISTSGGSSTTSGVTGTLNGFNFVDGLVKAIPADLITKVTATATGLQNAQFTFLAVPNISIPGRVDFSLNLDVLYNTLDSKITSLDSSQGSLITALTGTVSNLQNSLTGLQNTLTSQQATLTAQQSTINSIQSSLGTLTSQFNAYVATHP
jgi:hypothetical protein